MKGLVLEVWGEKNERGITSQRENAKQHQMQLKGPIK